MRDPLRMASVAPCASSTPVSSRACPAGPVRNSSLIVAAFAVVPTTASRAAAARGGPAADRVGRGVRQGVGRCIFSPRKRGQRGGAIPYQGSRAGPRVFGVVGFDSGWCGASCIRPAQTACREGGDAPVPSSMGRG